MLAMVENLILKIGTTSMHNKRRTIYIQCYGRAVTGIPIFTVAVPVTNEYNQLVGVFAGAIGTDKPPEIANNIKMGKMELELS